MNGKQLKNSILQWAIQGKLVPQDPNDELASVLLERIREEKARLVKEKKIKKDKNESIIFRGDDNSHYEKFADGTIKCINDEIPFEIPQSWCWVRLGNIGDWGSGSTPAKGRPDYYGGNILWLRTGELNNGTVYDTEIKITEKALNECSFRLNKVGDVMIAMYGATIGKVAIAGKEMTTNQACCGCTPICILNKYLFYFLMGSQEDFIKKGEGGAQPNISREKIVAHLMPLPPFEEQNRIVEKIESVLPFIELYGKSQDKLNALNKSIFPLLRKSVLQEAIQGKLVPQDPNDEPASILLERIKEEKAKLFKEGKLKKKDLVDSVIFKGDDNKYYEKIDGKTECINERIPFEIPQNWLWTTLGNLVQNCSGLAYKKENLDERSDSYIRVLRGGNIDDGKWSIKNDDVMIASKFVKTELLLTAGTFITPAVTSIEQMGKTALVRDDQPQTVVGGFVLMLLPFLRDWSLLDYLELIFQSEYYKGYCRSITNKSGQAFYNLSRQKLMQFLVPLPPLNERIAIANEVAKINSMMR